MYALRLDIQYPALARRRDPARLFRQERHRERLIQQPQLPALRLLVVRVAEDAAV